GQTNDSGFLNAGTYSVSEVNIPAGWDFTDATIIDPDGGSTDIANLDLDPGETITVIVSNTQQATVTVVKNSIGGNATFDFDGTGALPTDFDITTAGNTGSQKFVIAKPGLEGDSASVTEPLANLPAGWNFTSLVVTGDSGAV